MRTTAALALALALAVAGPVSAQTTRTTARAADIAQLQDELASLDDAMALLTPDSPRSAEFHRRSDAIRDDVVRLDRQIRDYRQANTDGLGAPYTDVVDLRQRISALREDIEVAYGRHYATGVTRLPAGTVLDLRLEQSLSSQTAHLEDRVDATVARPVRLDDRTVLPVGTRVSGVVRDVQPAERPLKGGRLEIVFDQVWVDASTRVDLRGRVVSLKQDLDRGQTAKQAGLAAAIGGVVGAVLGGSKGATIGVLVGATGGLAANKGDELFVPEGSIVSVELVDPLVIERH